MRTRFGLKIQEFQTPAPAPSGIVHRAALSRWLSEQGVVQTARAQAAQLLRKARAQRVHFYTLCQQHVTKVVQQHAERCTAQAEERLKTAIDQAIVWAIDEDHFEASLYHSLLLKVNEWVATTLGTFAPHVPWTDLLAKQVQQQLGAIPEGGALTLHVAAQDIEALKAALGSTPLRLKQDDALQTGQAQLSNAWVDIRFDLQAHWKQLLRQLSARA